MKEKQNNAQLSRYPFQAAWGAPISCPGSTGLYLPCAYLLAFTWRLTQIALIGCAKT